ncbi:MAG: hypothetical protein LBV67_07445 [Streptococcaceae bacterium]|jgi:hypothetical protein|nr:hypothetical protein [Streptococcaceae bacterium]
MNLEQYFGKKVKIVDTDNKEWVGFVNTFIPAIDNSTYNPELDEFVDDPVDEIGIPYAGGITSFREEDIKTIEVID